MKRMEGYTLTHTSVCLLACLWVYGGIDLCTSWRELPQNGGKLLGVSRYLVCTRMSTVKVPVLGDKHVFRPNAKTLIRNIKLCNRYVFGLWKCPEHHTTASPTKAPPQPTSSRPPHPQASDPSQIWVPHMGA